MLRGSKIFVVAMVMVKEEEEEEKAGLVRWLLYSPSCWSE
jgi:hypothetical protein